MEERWTEEVEICSCSHTGMEHAKPWEDLNDDTVPFKCCKCDCSRMVKTGEVITVDFGPVF